MQQMNFDEIKTERMELAAERISQIAADSNVPVPFARFFKEEAQFITKMLELSEIIREKKTQQWTLEEWKLNNESLYADILPEQYQTSFGNPEYAVQELGEVHGRILSFLYAEIRGLIVFAFEQRWDDILIICELFIEIYNCFEEEELPGYRQIQQIIYWYVSDYSDQTLAYRIREAVDPSLDFATKIIMESDLNDLRYLYQYGEYVNDSIIETAKFLNRLPQEEIDRIASVYTEGYRIGFILGNKD